MPLCPKLAESGTRFGIDGPAWNWVQGVDAVRPSPSTVIRYLRPVHPPNLCKDFRSVFALFDIVERRPPWQVKCRLLSGYEGNFKGGVGERHRFSVAQQASAIGRAGP